MQPVSVSSGQAASDVFAEADRLCAALAPDVVAMRRDLHAHPEVGWTEYRTTARVREALMPLGLTLRFGRELYDGVDRLGVPADDILKDAEARAATAGIEPDVLDAMRGGHSGLVAVMEGTGPGPTIALRAELDALPLEESAASVHAPAREGFRSTLPGVMHACAHDGHTAVAVGVARALTNLERPFGGRIVFVFQPAEEGTRGADALVKAGHLADVDVALTFHILADVGLGSNEVTPDVGGMLATRKVRVRCDGVPSQFASSPHLGRNALTVATAIVSLANAIPHAPGTRSMINCGRLVAGTAANIVPASATIDAEIRAEDAMELERLSEAFDVLVAGVGSSFGVTTSIETTGYAPSAIASPSLAAVIRDQARHIGATVRGQVSLGASDDAALLMAEAQRRGGEGVYLGLGAGPPRPHHSPGFDFDEPVLDLATKLLVRTIIAVGGSNGRPVDFSAVRR
jgi:aminobenzoyl-glutamate utilization protein A